MLLTLKVLHQIQASQIDLVFRRWQKPTVKPGGRLRTAIGELTIETVTIVDPISISDEEARRAGFESGDAVRHDLFRERTATGARARVARPTDASVIYRVEVRYAGVDGRASLRDTLLSDAEMTSTLARLSAMDARCPRGPWTSRTLGLLETWPGRRAPELAELENRETLAFKADVRKLKELALTESLTVGYRLSPRGEQTLKALRSTRRAGREPTA